ncbi:MAG TPA: hypothetical protein VG897_16370 [Terriglobales bacterium]|jgi:hypothetical protein|nr:hypothetical protein [Terriglobales bacterium]
MSSFAGEDKRELPLLDLAPNEIQSGLNHILRSETFRHSEQLRVLLSYLGQKSIEGQADELKEYSVGIDAMGKPESYSPRQDATVRIQTGRLRLKLEEYFRTEGASAPVIFELPKGGFKIVFRRRTKIPPEPVQTAPASAPWTRDASILRRVCLALAIGLLAATAAASYAFLSRRPYVSTLAASVWNRDLLEIWHPFLISGRPVTVALGTPLFVSFDGVPVRDSRMNEWQAGYLSPTLDRIRRALRSTDVHPAYQYNGFGETVGALRIFRLFLCRERDVSFRRANSLAWEDLRERDIVLLGSPKSIAHLKRFREVHTQLPFDIGQDAIVNYYPAQGEQATYPGASPSDAPSYETYSLITRLPGTDGAGNVMILGSPDTQGTLAAVEFVTSPSYAAELHRLLVRNRKALPDAYQVLINVTVRADGPLTMKPVTFRILRTGSNSSLVAKIP